MPIGYKLEGFIIKMLETCCEPPFKASQKIGRSFFAKKDDDSDYEWYIYSVNP